MRLVDERLVGVGGREDGRVMQLVTPRQSGRGDDGRAVAAVFGTAEKIAFDCVQVERAQVFAGGRDGEEDFFGADHCSGRGFPRGGGADGHLDAALITLLFRAPDTGNDGVREHVLFAEGRVDGVVEKLVATVDVEHAGLPEEDFHPGWGEGLQEGEGHDIGKVTMASGWTAARGLVHSRQRVGHVPLLCELANGQKQVLGNLRAGRQVPESRFNHLVPALGDHQVVEADDGCGGAEGVRAGVVGGKLETAGEVDVAGDGGAAGAETREKGQVKAGDEIEPVEVGEVDLYAVFAGDGRDGGGIEVGVYVAALVVTVSYGGGRGAAEGEVGLTRMASFSIKTTLLL